MVGRGLTLVSRVALYVGSVVALVTGGIAIARAPAVTQQIAGLLLLIFGVLSFGVAEILSTIEH